jgi:hypothetical protein
MKQMPRKATYVEAVAIIKTDLARVMYPAASANNNGMSMGFWRLKWHHLKGQSIFEAERIKTGLRSSGCRC